MVILFELVAVLAALTLGFILGRIWEIRKTVQLSAPMTAPMGAADHTFAGEQYM
jgi:hypothetical protein